jgi:diaminobutyrate-2-oxoglutarate transaminase
MINDGVFQSLESEVRSYCRDFPAVFVRAKDHVLEAEDGRRFIDFFSGAGTLNYGHNHAAIKRALVAYLEDDGIVHALDMYTGAKRRFLEALRDVVLAPRGLDYKVQFTGPTGANAVEAALKLARKVTGRSHVIAFTNGYHGLSLGALAATSRRRYRAVAGQSLGNVTHMPYDGYHGSADTVAMLERALSDPGSGLDEPAAIIVESVQGEGGLNVATADWLRRLHGLARGRGIVLILDEIQSGCGRTGDFFGFEQAGIEPDLVCVSKSISGIGLPMALVLIRPDLDRWSPGEHTGTFRGNNLAFVAAAAALELWRDGRLQGQVRRHAELISKRLEAICSTGGRNDIERRGRGLMQGLAFADAEEAGRVSQRAFGLGLVAETCGGHNEVLKLLPPLTITEDALRAGLDILSSAVLGGSVAGAERRHA